MNSVRVLCRLGRSGRPVTSLPALVFAACVIALNSDLNFVWAVVRSVPIYLITAAGFIFNDIFDQEKDRDAGVCRPIAQGELSRKSAIWGALVLVSMAVGWELARGSFDTALLLVAVAAGVFIYTPVAHVIPVVKGLFTAMLCVTPLLYGQMITHTQLYSEAVIVLVAFISGRELLLDLRDLDADIRYGMRTLPHYLGQTVSKLAGWGLLMLSGVLFLMFSGALLSYILGGAALLVLCVCFCIYTWVQKPLGLRLTRIAMLLGGLCISTLSR